MKNSLDLSYERYFGDTRVLPHNAAGLFATHLGVYRQEECRKKDCEIDYLVASSKQDVGEIAGILFYFQNEIDILR